MERKELFDLMGALKLYGMRASYDDDGVGDQAPARAAESVGDLLKAEIAEKPHCPVAGRSHAAVGNLQI